MLHKQTVRQTFQEHAPEEEHGQPITLAYLYDTVKRRLLFFAIPFVLILTAGTGAALLWPASYISEGTILVEAQQIPTNLVQPTVVGAANERLQSIDQRIMTRDNLLAIAKKYGMFTGWRQWLSGTQIVDFIRKRKIITPVQLKSSNWHDNGQVLAFKVGFEYEQPQIAMKVANDFITMILNEDAKTRSSFATETTKFLERDVQRIEDQIRALDAQIAKLQTQQTDSSNPEALSAAKTLATLREELALKQATLSDQHPEVKALKKKIAALQKIASSETALPVGADTLLSRRKALKDELIVASQKLSTARLGESLERGQISERLEVIEQPTLPQKPVSPNRRKIFGLAVLLALMAGGALVAALEFFDSTVRRAADLFAIVDKQLVVTIPYISTVAEENRRKRTTKLWIGAAAIAAIGAVVAALLLLPLDLILDKILAHV